MFTGCNLGSEKFWLLGRNSLRWAGIYAAFKLLTSVWCLLVIICDKICCIADINACIPSILIVYHTVLIYDSINIYRLNIHIALICCILLYYYAIFMKFRGFDHDFCDLFITFVRVCQLSQLRQVFYRYLPLT